MNNFGEVLLGSGCFWGKEFHLSRLPGVTGTQVGFAGGSVSNPSYREVCHKQTGHAEVVRVTYDADHLSLYDLLVYFFSLHDPRIDRRDRGGQYRSAVYFTQADDPGAGLVREMLAHLQERGYAPYTEVETGVPFYPAEDRHQGYCEVNGFQPRNGRGISAGEWSDFDKKREKC